MKTFFINISYAGFFITMIALFCSCGSANTKEATKETTIQSDSTKKEEGIAEISEAQMKTVGIELGIIEQQNLTSVIKATGQLAVPPQNKAVVNALVGGVIKTITVSEGRQVSKEQEVVSIENPDFIKLQQDYLTTKNNIVYLEQEYERQKTLKEADAGIGKVYQQASANYAAEQSKLQTLEAQLRQIHINPSQVSKGNIIKQVPVLAPISGTVGKINLSVGTYTDAASPIMEIINNSNMHCDLHVFEKDIINVKIGQPVRFTVTSLDNKQVSGKIFGINKSLEQENKSVVVHAIVNNVAPLNLIGGMYVSALIETGKAMVPAVPKDAIVKVVDKSYIFVLEGTENEKVQKNTDAKKAGRNDTTLKYRFKMIEVVPGVEELGYVQITLVEDIPPDAKIVTKGAFYIWSGMQNTETDDL